jgi:Arc/MetJ-type ribon-helix-helix transcriptional regulator
MADGTQIAVRIGTDVLRELDQLVEDEHFGSRAEAVRHALDVVLDARRRAAVGAQIVEGYTRHPQTDADEAQAVANLKTLVAQEPW